MPAMTFSHDLTNWRPDVDVEPWDEAVIVRAILPTSCGPSMLSKTWNKYCGQWNLNESINNKKIKEKNFTLTQLDELILIYY